MLEVPKSFQSWFEVVVGGFVLMNMIFYVSVESGCIRLCVRYDDEERHCVRNLLEVMYV